VSFRHGLSLDQRDDDLETTNSSINAAPSLRVVFSSKARKFTRSVETVKFAMSSVEDRMVARSGLLDVVLSGMQAWLCGK